MRKILIWLSGAHREVLDLTPTERPKYEGIGGVVLTTAVMAALSCGFALTFALDAPLYASVPLGLLWGLAIMNLDRWLISATPRRESWFRNLVQILPRFLMALLIGAVISTPLVIRVFDKEISNQLEVMQQRDQDANARQQAADQANVEKLRKAADHWRQARDATIDDPVVRDYPAVVKAGNALTTSRKRYETALQQYTDNPTSENNRLLNDARNARRGDQQQYDRARSQAVRELRSDGKANYDNAQRDYENAKKRFDTNRDQFNETSEKNTGLLARLEALRELTATDGTLRRAYLLLLLFITMIEVLPVFVKFLMTLGTPNSYEKALVRYEAARLREAEVAMEDRETATNLNYQARAKRREDDARMEEELEQTRRENRREEALETEANRRRRNSTSTYGRM